MFCDIFLFCSQNILRFAFLLLKVYHMNKENEKKQQMEFLNILL